LGVRVRARSDDHPTRTVETYRWGLLGPCITDPGKAGSTFNARAETVATDPTFRKPFRERRLIIPADPTSSGGSCPAARRSAKPSDEPMSDPDIATALVNDV